MKGASRTLLALVLLASSAAALSAQQLPRLITFDTVAVVGVEDGNERETFGTIHAIAARPNGEFFVLDLQASSVSWFDPNGSFKGAITARGGGPGELSGAADLSVAPDGSLYVLDAGNARVSIFRTNSSRLTFERSRPNVLGGRNFCVLNDRVFVNVIRDNRLIHELADAPASRISFGDVVKPEGLEGLGPFRAMAESMLLAGRVFCAYDPALIIAASTSQPYIRAFHPNGTPAWSTTLAQFYSARSLQVQRELIVGATDDIRQNLTEVAGLTIGPDGSVYIVQHQEKTIRVFSPEGELLRTIGRSGQGPGEFTSPRWIGWLRDTLWVADVAASRMNLYDALGTFRGQIGFVTPGAQPGHLASRPGFLLGDGAVLTATEAASEDIATGVVQSLPLYRTNRQGERLAVIASLATRNMLASAKFPDRPGGFYFSQPFSDATLWAIGPRGAPIVVVDRPEPASARVASFHVTVLGFTGDTVLEKSFPYDPRPLERSIRDAWLDRQVAQFRNAPSWFPRIDQELYLRFLYTPKFMPPVTGLLVGSDSTIWIRREFSEQPVTTWWLLDRSGQHTATVELPIEFTALAVSGDAAWGIELDDLDVPRVVRYRLMGR